ncbi:MAG TPA: ornithine cyclodeaminase family protein [Clostridia bacterium]|nr:ornithine cyclodeaminase family protein [Clostridia bacterium]
MIRIIKKSQVEQLVDMQAAIELLDKVFISYGKGKLCLPLRTQVPVEAHNGCILYMPVYLPEMEALGCKIITVFPDNPGKNRPTIYSNIILNDPETGELLALMDGEYITALRTGGISGLAAKYLSREDADTVCVFGAGMQARTQLEAVCAVRSIRRAYVFDVSEANALKYCGEMSQRLGIEVSAGKNQRESLVNSQIILTATTSGTPLFNGEDVPDGAFVSGVGSYTPQTRELPEELLMKSEVVVDAYEAALKEAGDLIIPMEKGLISRQDIKAELSEVVTGHYMRNNDSQIIVFKTVGIAIQDMCIAPYVYKKAVEQSIGLSADLR